MRQVTSRLLRFCIDQSGAAAVEFALVSVAFLTLIFGISYTGIMLFHNATLYWAVERAARVAAIDASVTQGDIASDVNKYLATTGVSDANVVYSVSSSGGIPVAQITASFTRTYTVPLVSTFTINYSATTSVPQGS